MINDLAHLYAQDRAVKCLTASIGDSAVSRHDAGHCIDRLSFGSERYAVEVVSGVAKQGFQHRNNTPIGVEAPRRSTVIKSLHFSIVAVALLLLLFEGVYIFRPMAKMVQTPADDLERRATIDGLTGLLNRSAFEARFRAKLDDARAEPGGGSTIALAVISIDLDWFKEVNDLEGHAAGDAVLREIGARIRAVASEGCLASRMGGDEFVIVVPFGAADQRCRDMADRIREAIERPLPWNGKFLRVGAQLGSQTFPDHGLGFDQLLNAADYALREGKKLGKGAIQPFASEHQESLELQTAILRRSKPECLRRVWG